MCYACLSDLLREVIISIGWESAGLDARSPFDPRISKFVGFIDVPTLRQFGVWNYAGSTIVSRTRPHRKGALVGEENTPSETARVAQVRVVGFPPELYAGTTHTCVFEAPYGEGGDLLGCGAELLDGSGACVYRCAFAVFEDGVARSKPFEVKAPAEPGTYTWTVLLLDAQGKIRGGAKGSVAARSARRFVPSRRLPTERAFRRRGRPMRYPPVGRFPCMSGYRALRTAIFLVARCACSTEAVRWWAAACSSPAMRPSMRVFQGRRSS